MKHEASRLGWGWDGMVGQSVHGGMVSQGGLDGLVD